MKKIFLLLLVFFFAGSPSAYGDSRRFIPRFVGYGADLISDFKFESDEKKVEQDRLNGQTVTRSKRTKEKLRQTLKLSTLGYVYHPNLFKFQLSGSGNIDEEKDTSNNSRMQKSDTGHGYSFSGEFLPKKKLRASVFSDLSQPISSGFTDAQDELSRSGVDVKYYNLPWRHSFSYHTSDDLINTTRKERDDYALKLLYYNKKNFTMGADLGNYTLRSNGQKNVREHYALYNQSGFNKIKSKTAFSFDRELGAEKVVKITEFQEELNLKLPWNLEMDTGYEHDRHTSDSIGLNTGQLDRNSLQREDIYASLNQKLFESLLSRVSARYQSNTSGQGTFDRKNYLLSSSYKKKLRGGYVTGSAAKEINLIDRKGSVRIEGELFGGITEAVAQGDVSFALKELEIEPGSVQIEIDTDGDGSWKILNSATSWEFVSTGTITTVSIYDLAATVPGIDASQPYNFRVNYYTRESDYVLRASSTDLQIGGGLFEGVISGAYTHSATTQEVVEGDPQISGLSPALTSNTLEVFYKKDPFDLSASYRVIDADFQEKKWQVAGDYSKSFVIMEPVRSALRGHYDKAETQTKQPGGEMTTAMQYSYLIDLRSTLKLPRLPITLIHKVGTDKHQGAIPNFERNELGYYSTMTTLTTDQSKIYTSIGLLMSTRIPWLRLPFTMRGLYGYENYTSGRTQLHSKYSVYSNYTWVFGATSLRLEGKYEWDRMDNETRTTRDVTTSGEGELTMKLIRRIF